MTLAAPLKRKLSPTTAQPFVYASDEYLAAKASSAIRSNEKTNVPAMAFHRDGEDEAEIEADVPAMAFRRDEGDDTDIQPDVPAMACRRDEDGEATAEPDVPAMAFRA